MKLTFLGAAGTVTGSRYLLEHDSRSLLVDCGLFQGYKNLRLMNREPFPFDPARLDAVVLTHAHLDHSGALPLLVQRGFRGPVLATPSTIELCRVMLPDSARLQEEDAAEANREQYSRHAPALPLYTQDDAESALRRFEALPFDERVDVVGAIAVRLQRAGHILGAAAAAVSAGGTTLLFSGDLGRPDDPLMHPPEPPCRAEHIVVEATYGDREHERVDVEALLGEVITRTAARGGTVVVPAFAVGRAQALLHAIHRLKLREAIPDLPVYLDSPMAADMTAIYYRYRAEHRLTTEEFSAMCRAATVTPDIEESRRLDRLRHPAVIISASGMATGGRVLHHLKALAPERRLVARRAAGAPDAMAHARRAGARGRAAAADRARARVERASAGTGPIRPAGDATGVLTATRNRQYSSNPIAPAPTTTATGETRQPTSSAMPAATIAMSVSVCTVPVHIGW